MIHTEGRLSLSKGETIRIFEGLHSSLPSGCASLSIREDVKGIDLSVDLLPSNPKAAAINAGLEEDRMIYLTFGRGASFEVPAEGRRYTNLPCLEEVRALCSAVMAGDFEETVVFVGSELVGAHGVIRIAGRSIQERYRKLTLNPFRRKQKVHFAYLPYWFPHSATRTHSDEPVQR